MPCRKGWKAEDLNRILAVKIADLAKLNAKDTKSQSEDQPANVKEVEK